MKPKSPSESDDKTMLVGRRGPDDTKPLHAPVDSKTVFIREPRAIDQDDSTRIVDPSGEDAPNDRPRLSWPARDQHRPVPDEIRRNDERNTPPASGHQASEATRLFQPTGEKVVDRSPADDGARRDARDGTGAFDPVVGWLVVVSGPGRGRSIELGIGANSIGRDRDQGVCLDFGDNEIHRRKHATLVYDPKSRRYFLQSGDVRNLTYVGDELVLAPVQLKGGEMIVIGQTQLRFVAFCGPEFNWS